MQGRQSHPTHPKMCLYQYPNISLRRRTKTAVVVVVVVEQLGMNKKTMGVRPVQSVVVQKREIPTCHEAAAFHKSAARPVRCRRNRAKVAEPYRLRRKHVDCHHLVLDVPIGDPSYANTPEAA